MSQQIAVRLPEELAARLDEMVRTGRYETRADAVRAALEALFEAERRRQIGERIVEGYRRIPQTEDDVAAAAAAATRSIDEEPW